MLPCLDFSNCSNSALNFPFLTEPIFPQMEQYPYNFVFMNVFPANAIGY
nr:MAG TPA: hypothetical protein [Caudoviricetes sp.]